MIAYLCSSSDPNWPMGLQILKLDQGRPFHRRSGTASSRPSSSKRSPSPSWQSGGTALSWPPLFSPHERSVTFQQLLRYLVFTYVSRLLKMMCVEVFEICCLPHDSKRIKYTSVETEVLLDNCLLYVEPGWPRLLCVSLWKQMEGFHHPNALVIYICRISQPCFSRFPGSFWGCCRWNTGTLSVYRTGCGRRENGGPENICQNRWALKKILHGTCPPPPTSPIKMFLSPPSLVTIIGGIVFLAFALSALFFKPDAGINWRERDLVFLCKYVET